MFQEVNFSSNLENVYGQWGNPIQGVKQISENESLSKLMTEKYQTYFDALTEELDDSILANRLANKRYLAKPASHLHNILKLAASLLGPLAPTAELVITAGIHLPHIFSYCVHLTHEAIEVMENGSVLLHDLERLPNTSGLRKRPFKIFKNLIAQELTFRYRHELLHMSLEKCADLGKRHFIQIDEYLKKAVAVENTFSIETLLEDTLEAVDPLDMRDTIHNTIVNYIIEKQGIFSMVADYSQEISSLLDLLVAIYGPNPNFDEMIDTISGKVIFRYTWKFLSFEASLADENINFSRLNPVLLTLNSLEGKSLPTENLLEQPREDEKIRFASSPLSLGLPKHKIAKGIAREILLMIFKWKTQEAYASKNEAYEKINRTALEVIQRVSVKPVIQELKDRISILEKKMDMLLKERELSHQMPSTTADNQDLPMDEEPPQRVELLEIEIESESDFGFEITETSSLDKVERAIEAKIIELAIAIKENKDVSKLVNIVFNPTETIVTFDRRVSLLKEWLEGVEIPATIALRIKINAHVSARLGGHDVLLKDLPNNEILSPLLFV